MPTQNEQTTEQTTPQDLHDDTSTHEPTSDQAPQPEVDSGDDVTLSPATESIDSAGVLHSGAKPQSAPEAGFGQAKAETNQTQGESTPESSEQPPEAESQDQKPSGEAESTPPKLPDLQDTKPQLPNTDKLDKFQEELEQTIAQNAGVITNTHYTLQGIAQLLEISKDLWRFYSYHGESLKLSNEQINQLKGSLQAIATYINQALETIASSHTAAQNLFTTTEALLDEAKREVLKIDSDLTAVKDALKKIQEIELSLQKISELNAELRANIALAEAMKKEINALVPNILNEVKANLLADKEQYERELEAKKNEYAALLDEKLAGLDEKIADFESDYINKQRVMDEALKKLEEFIATLEAQKIEFRTSFETYLRELKAAHDTHTASLQATHDAHAQALQDFKDEKQNELETFKGEKQSQLQDFKEQKCENLTTHATTQISRIESASANAQNEIRVFSEDFLREVNAFNSAAILELRELYYAIATNAQQLGNGYESKSFTASGNFTLIPGVRDYFVFVRGGTGGSNNSNAGGISSFGSYASANGGAGNSGGAGQRGESKAQFVHIKDETITSVKVSVASGGVVIVSWAKDLEAKVDTSFFTQADLEAITGSTDAQAHERFKASITDKKEENYWRSVCGLDVNLAPITQENLHRIKLRLPNTDPTKPPLTFSTLRALEIYVAELFLTENKPISAFITRETNMAPALTIHATPERVELEVGASASVQVSVDEDARTAPTATLSSAHASFDLASGVVQGLSAGECEITLELYDDLKQKTITERVQVIVSEPAPTPPEPPKEPEAPETEAPETDTPEAPDENGESGQGEQGGESGGDTGENGEVQPEAPEPPKEPELTPIQVCAQTILAQTTATPAQFQAQVGKGFNSLITFLGDTHDYSSMGNGVKDDDKLQRVMRAYKQMLLQGGVIDDASADALLAEIIKLFN